MSSFCKKLNDGRWGQLNFNHFESIWSSLNVNKVDWTLMRFICVYLLNYMPLCTTTRHYATLRATMRLYAPHTRFVFVCNQPRWTPLKLFVCYTYIFCTSLHLIINLISCVLFKYKHFIALRGLSNPLMQ